MGSGLTLRPALFLLGFFKVGRCYIHNLFIYCYTITWNRNCDPIYGCAPNKRPTTCSPDIGESMPWPTIHLRPALFQLQPSEVSSSFELKLFIYCYTITLIQICDPIFGWALDKRPTTCSLDIGEAMAWPTIHLRPALFQPQPCGGCSSYVMNSFYFLLYHNFESNL